MDERLAANQANWDERVGIHVASDFYDVDGWLATKPGPRPWEADVIGDVAGLAVVHLQCHFGLDTLALANAGARVTGLDFSSEAIAAATDIAFRAGLADRARFVQADVQEAAAALAPDTFDLVYVSLGALCWLPSVAVWAEQVGRLLRPGGRLYLHDGHPLAFAFADDDMHIEYTYFEETDPAVFDDDVTYTDGDLPISHTRTYEWNHSLGEIVAAVLGVGLRIDRLDEHDWTVYQRFPWLQPTDDGRWVRPPGTIPVPLTFTLAASNPA